VPGCQKINIVSIFFKSFIIPREIASIVDYLIVNGRLSPPSAAMDNTRQWIISSNVLYCMLYTAGVNFDNEISDYRGEHMGFFEAYGKEIVSLCVPFITWFLNVALKAKTRLVWNKPHEFDMLVHEPLRNPAGEVVQQSQVVRTASIRVKSIGRQGATKIELVFNWRPQYINIWPVRSYEEKLLDDRRYILVFDNLSLGEEIGIEIMAINAELPRLILVRCAECVAEQIGMRWVRDVAQWRVSLVLFLAGLGSATAMYFLIVLIQLLVLRTPTP
jgi:hypothetical protein